MKCPHCGARIKKKRAISWRIREWVIAKVYPAALGHRVANRKHYAKNRNIILEKQKIYRALKKIKETP